MARHPGLPKPAASILSKADLLAILEKVDGEPSARERVLALESDFRSRIDSHILSLPGGASAFRKLGTSPYVLLFQSLKRGYSMISQIEADILPAKVFSSMETSAGRMIEAVALPVYGWECVESEMHSANSALDGKRVGKTKVEVATLKSGPRCLNDEMAENFADSILSHVKTWAEEADVAKVDFTYGVLYGTERQSNKKDWHILRNLKQKVGGAGGTMTVQPDGQWHCAFELDGVEATVAVRVGAKWWDHLGGSDCAVELWTALIRACVVPGAEDAVNHVYEISDLGSIVSTDRVPDSYNVGLLQKSQLPWLFLVAQHFCDELTD